jgi:hypothetical protein
VIANVPRKLVDDWLSSPASTAGRFGRRLAAARRRIFGQEALGLGEIMFDKNSIPDLYRQRVEISLRAFHDYQPSHYHGDILVIKAKVRPFLHRADASLGWGSWTDGQVEVRTVSGHHGNLLTEPHVRQVASVIAQALGTGFPT